MSSPKKKKGLKIFFEPEMSRNFKIQTRFFLSHCRPSNWLQVREIARPNFSPEPSPDSKKNARPWKKLFSSSSQNCWCFNGMKQSCSRPELSSFRASELPRRNESISIRAERRSDERLDHRSRHKEIGSNRYFNVADSLVLLFLIH